jgi:Sugar (and other) transporter
MCSGAFSVFVPKFINEIAPIEYKGPFGAAGQFMCTAGIFLAALMGVPIPDDVSNLPLDSFKV